MSHCVPFGRNRLVACSRGTTAVEFAILAPVIFALLIGTVTLCIALGSQTSLQTAVEGAARCYSVNSSTCGSPAAAQNYARQQYQGEGSPTFTASLQSCGHQVSASLSAQLTAVVINRTIPLTATACYP